MLRRNLLTFIKVSLFSVLFLSNINIINAANQPDLKIGNIYLYGSKFQLRVEQANVGDVSIDEKTLGKTYIYVYNNSDGSLYKQMKYSWSTLANKNFLKAGGISTLQIVGLPSKDFTVYACIDTTNQVTNEIDEPNALDCKTLVNSNNLGKKDLSIDTISDGGMSFSLSSFSPSSITYLPNTKDISPFYIDVRGAYDVKVNKFTVKFDYKLKTLSDGIATFTISNCTQENVTNAIIAKFQNIKLYSYSDLDGVETQITQTIIQPLTLSASDIYFDFSKNSCNVNNVKYQFNDQWVMLYTYDNKSIKVALDLTEEATQDEEFKVKLTNLNESTSNEYYFEYFDTGTRVDSEDVTGEPIGAPMKISEATLFVVENSPNNPSSEISQTQTHILLGQFALDANEVSKINLSNISFTFIPDITGNVKYFQNIKVYDRNDNLLLCSLDKLQQDLINGTSAKMNCDLLATRILNG